MIKAIIYDKDGTLMRFDEFWVPVAQAAIKTLIEKTADVNVEASFKIAEEIAKNIGIRNGTIDPKGILCGGTYTQFAETVNQVFKIFGSAAEIDRSVVEQAVAANTDKGVILSTCEDLRGRLEQARKKARLFVVTTDDRPMTEFCLKKLGLFDLFDGIYCDDGKTPHKPDPFAADDIAKILHIGKSEIVMVGDTATDKRFADNAGIDFVFVGKDSELKENSVYVTDNAGSATDLILSLL